ncbi:afadin- and alpha-actinin-binding protein isoform X3 [Nerophis ophidion]|uniref:afadin- and alpha-actinin-binding protein isoform X3 n=1 Tax=Nerophis ophidion TaxID=159077 RepID=UPI002AE05646|nr:afadin- and alpha-actinin-binding protein isoform X3 [Nerophis ophidion]
MNSRTTQQSRKTSKAPTSHRHIPSMDCSEQNSRLQLRCKQQEAELKRREQQSNRMKERLTRLNDGQDKGQHIQLLNFLRGGRGSKEQSIEAIKQEEAMLLLMLERREAELREAMKLRHSTTTLLHAIRLDMEQTLSNVQNAEYEFLNEDKRLIQAESALGDHVTGGVLQSWKQVQRKLRDLLTEGGPKFEPCFGGMEAEAGPGGHAGVSTDQDKLLTRLHAELKESQQIIILQQQILQDSLPSLGPSELTDSYYLEEWERLQARWAEFKHQKQTFERERQSFTDAAIRLSRERRDFEHQKALILKQQYLRCCTQKVNKLISFGDESPSCWIPISPYSKEPSPVTCDAASGDSQGRDRILTPTTPELYAVLGLSYQCSAEDGERCEAR